MTFLEYEIIQSADVPRIGSDWGGYVRALDNCIGNGGLGNSQDEQLVDGMGLFVLTGFWYLIYNGES